MLALFVAVALDLTIVDKPIPFDEERVRLTLEYRRAHQDPEAKDITIAPKVVVLHYTAGGSAEGTFRYLSRTRLEKGRKKLARAGAVNVSAHFLVDRDGTVIRLMPETWMARHTIGLNHVAIGVENVGDGKKYPLTDAQVEANAQLVRYLAGRYELTHLIGHSESPRLAAHPYYVERDRTYENAKGDPGAEFLARVREKVADLRLEGPPAVAK